MPSLSNQGQAGLNAYNYIQQTLAGNWSNLPVGTADNISTISTILLDSAYTPMTNEFISTLINRIALTIVRNKVYNNPLQMFKKGSVPLGTDIQEIYTNPAEREQYEFNNQAMAKLLTITDPDTHVAYYRRNVQDKYKTTISREELRGAFVSWERFEEFIESITNSLYSKCYIDEFLYTKGLVDGAFDNNKVIVEVVTAPTDEATSKAFLKKCRSLYNKITFPSEDYNAYTKFSGSVGRITTWTDRDRIVLITTADVLANVDVESLASAFNIDKADFIGRVISVDKFENPDIQAIICDESWFQIYENLFRFDEFYNSEVMAWNLYLHRWATYAISPFANAICLSTTEPKLVTAISVPDTTVVAGDDATVTITLTPSDATSDIYFESLDVTKFSVQKVDNTHCVVHGISSGTATLKAYSDNGVVGNGTITIEPEVPLTAITLQNKSVAVGADAEVTATLTPTNATTKVSYFSDDDTKFTVVKLSNKKCKVTGVGAGSASLKAKAANNVEGSSTITVTTP